MSIPEFQTCVDNETSSLLCRMIIPILKKWAPVRHVLMVDVTVRITIEDTHMPNYPNHENHENHELPYPSIHSVDGVATPRQDVWKGSSISESNTKIPDWMDLSHAPIRGRSARDSVKSGGLRQVYHPRNRKSQDVVQEVQVARFSRIGNFLPEYMSSGDAQ